MSAGINRFRADLREIHFVLSEQFRFGEIAGRGPFKDWSEDLAKAVIEQCYRFTTEVLGPLCASADREGCRLENGQVGTPAGFPEAWRKLYELGMKGVSAKPEHGGQGAPRMLHAIIEELTSGCNPAFNMYPGLSVGVGDLLAECGTPDQVHRYVGKMFSGTWAGTMCLTEPHAGSDVGSARTQARKQPDGTYKVKGTKMFITAGDHDLTENIIHLVLARVENAPPGTKGLSLFIVPKRRLDAQGTSGAPNDVTVASLEHKMGINGSATCVLNFGDNDDCIGELVGGVENAGMSQMFRMMNGARIAVALQGVGTASAAYFSALEYARERKQGAHYRQWKDPRAPRVPIIEHPDVRRMLLDMKSHVEGTRALILKLVSHVDRAALLAGTDDEQAAYHRGQVELLTPLTKAFASDEGFRVCATAIQVFGGAGYLKDNPVEQATRDAKIYSIYEGTNHIQAMDLVGRKLGQAGGAHLQQFMGDVGQFVEKHRAHPVLGQAVEALAAGQEATITAAMGMLAWSQEDKTHLIALNANRFLRLMSQLAVGWMLLDAAAIAGEALNKVAASHPDHAFYEGKIASGLWFARNVLPEVELQARVIAAGDDSATALSDEAFGRF
ncbi:MAG TPA: acyl-CoA dehydrogenase [Myxococcales bacterium]|jgi:alkylation response protein AidB-like acyl-CoA dehydrogenase|nr:acyl-CoA dehydrogenase [Myxococcales bacterium]